MLQFDCFNIAQDFFSKTEISCQRYDTEFNLVNSETIVASDYDKLSQALFPFNYYCFQYLFFVFLRESQNPNMNFLNPFKKWLNICWQYALEQRIDKLKGHAPNIVTPKHNCQMEEFSSVKNFAQYLLNYTNKIFSTINWDDYNIILNEIEGELSYGKRRLSEDEEDSDDIELAIFSFVSEDFLNAIKESNHFHKESTNITVLQILKAPLPSRIDSEKVTYNDKNMVIYTNDISNDITPISEADIQHILDENISRNYSENIKFER